MCDLIKNEYSRKWGCEGSSFSADNEAAPLEGDGCGVKFAIDIFFRAFGGPRKHKKLDASGICLESLWFFAAWLPDAAVAMFNRSRLTRVGPGNVW